MLEAKPGLPVLLIIELFFQSPCMNMYALSSYDILNPVLTTVN